MILFLTLSLTSVAVFSAGVIESSAKNTGYVMDYTPGDVNRDGKVDGKDSVMMLQYLANWTVDIDLPPADVNCDNSVNGQDATMMIQKLAGWDITFPVRTTVPAIDSERYTNRVTEYSLSYGGTDALNRKVGLEGDVRPKQNDKYVGVFYFLWIGANGLNLYDNTKIMSQYSDAMYNENRWGPVGAFHFWGEPLFGYYVSHDKWVMRKHVQMLTDADVDFMVFDTTNASGRPTNTDITNAGGGNNLYAANALAMLEVLDECYRQGWDVPKIAFYTNSNSGSVMNTLYQEIYKAHPEYSHLWFNWEGKPMIVGDPNQANATVRSFFRIKGNQWPNEGLKGGDGFPWMEFDRILTESSVYTYNGKSMMNVSVAQHNATCKMSAYKYGSNDRTRSFAGGYRHTEPGAVNYGYNFAEQWDFALRHDPDMIFITGFNEWIAQRQPSQSGEPIVFVDNFDAEGGRDVEPMKGGYGDNYYLQMVEYIRKYKGVEPMISTDNDTTIHVKGGFGQWDYIRAFYRDFENDTVDRNQKSYGKVTYTNRTGRNDIMEAKVCNDNDNIYFFVKTKDAITAPKGNNWMNLYISTGNKSYSSWNGYDFMLNRIAPGETATLERYSGNDTAFHWSKAADVQYSVKGDMMMVAIPKAALGINGTDFTIQFKWSDNCTSGDFYSFYTDGDAAPYGRLNYVYSAGK